MKLPTSPADIAELERLMADVQAHKTRWLDSVDRLQEWIAQWDRPALDTSRIPKQNREFADR